MFLFICFLWCWSDNFDEDNDDEDNDDAGPAICFIVEDHFLKPFIKEAKSDKIVIRVPSTKIQPLCYSEHPESDNVSAGEFADPADRGHHVLHRPVPCHSQGAHLRLWNPLRSRR